MSLNYPLEMKLNNIALANLYNFYSLITAAYILYMIGRRVSFGGKVNYEQIQFLTE